VFSIKLWTLCGKRALAGNDLMAWELMEQWCGASCDSANDKITSARDNNTDFGAEEAAQLLERPAVHVSAFVTTCPFRAPHHRISAVGLIGGGQLPMSGEVSLAHHGILFLDELQEFKRHVLEVLRRSVEESITRIQSPGHHWYLDFSRARSAGPVSIA
jgi:hypothetical protein